MSIYRYTSVLITFSDPLSWGNKCRDPVVHIYNLNLIILSISIYRWTYLSSISNYFVSENMFILSYFFMFYFLIVLFNAKPLISWGIKAVVQLQVHVTNTSVYFLSLIKDNVWTFSFKFSLHCSFCHVSIMKQNVTLFSKKKREQQTILLKVKLQTVEVQLHLLKRSSFP